MATAETTTKSGRASPPTRANRMPPTTHVPTGTYPAADDPLVIEFGVVMCNDDNAPAYRKDDMLLVRSLRLGEKPAPGGDYLFAQGTETGMHGQPARGTPVLVGRLKSASRTHWLCERHNAKGRRLSRREWPTVYVVVGKYNTSNPALRAKVEGGAK